uniref:Ty3 transposon capsid-like protein domain-containing protein n=1 Tax=Noccaea caerulescens TaxID=107243 RepID=A0A1J3JD73_NOCCA
MTRARAKELARINLVSERHDPMTDVSAQLAAFMEKLEKRFDLIEGKMNTMDEKFDKINEKVESNNAAIKALTLSPEQEQSSSKSKNAKNGQVQGQSVKFAADDLSEVEIHNGLIKDKGLPPPHAPTTTTSSTPIKIGNNLTGVIGGVSRVEHTPVFSGGPWQTRAVGRVRRHKDGGGDWRVRPIGWNEDNQQSYSPGDLQAQENDQGNTFNALAAHNSHPKQRVFPAVKMEFPPYDGTTNAIEWLQKCDDYFLDQGVFSDDARIRQATFVLTGQAYQWNHNLRRLVTHKLTWAEFKRICKSRFGKAYSVNPVGEITNLRHTSTIDEYCSQFEDCLGRQTRLTGDQQLWQFCAGLTDSLRKEVEYLRPETIFGLH